MNYAAKYLGKIVEIKIDRPLGTKHPKWKYMYPVNYGFVPNTKAPDGEEIDAYVLEINKPVKKFTDKCIAIIHRTDDEDDKLIVVPKKVLLSNKEIKKQTDFQERFFKSKIMRLKRELNRLKIKKTISQNHTPSEN